MNYNDERAPKNKTTCGTPSTNPRQYRAQELKSFPTVMMIF